MSALLDTTTGEITVIQPMTRAEAELHVRAVNNAAADMGRHLIELRERQGWRALGYESWTACLRNEFTLCRSYLYELMSAAPVVERLSTIPDMPQISTHAATALSDFDPDLQVTIARATLARYGSITEAGVRKVGAVYEESVRSGHVDTGSGVSTPVDAALTMEDVENVMRQRQHIADGSAWERVGIWLGSVAAASDVDGLGYATLRVPVEAIGALRELCESNAPVKIGVYQEKVQA